MSLSPRRRPVSRNLPASSGRTSMRNRSRSQSASRVSQSRGLRAAVATALGYDPSHGDRRAPDRVAARPDASRRRRSRSCRPRSPTVRRSSCASRSRAAAAPASSTRSASTAAPRRATRARVEGVTVVVDPFSAPYLRGATIDFLEWPPGVRVQDREPERRLLVRLRPLVPGRGGRGAPRGEHAGGGCGSGCCALTALAPATRRRSAA